MHGKGADLHARLDRENEGLPIARKRALALAGTFEESTIYINDGELVVGNTASRLKAAAIFPEYSVDWLLNEIDGIDHRPAESYEATGAQKAEIKELCAW